MPATLVIGTQWGDEGKGKVVDYYAKSAEYVVRFQGGNNAGHTIKVGEDVFKLHVTPSGVIQGKIGVIGNGVVIDPEVLLHEIEDLTKRGKKPQLRISDRANIIMPYHKILDGAEERVLGDKKIGTTGRGIGPCYSDKVARYGIRAGDLTDMQRLKRRLERVLPLKQKLFGLYGIEQRMDLDQILTAYASYGNRLRGYIGPTHVELNQALKEGKQVLLEGAQGTMLDVDYGTYPYTTSSNTVAGGACTGAGIGPQHITHIVGIVKAYTTRVGGGPFPTELSEKVGTYLQEKGHEFGTTTNRPRRCGWLDLVVVRHSCLLSGINALAVTKLDVLSGLDEVKVCTRYRIRGEETDVFPSGIDDVSECTPVYESFKGWAEFSSAVKKFSGLPKEAQAYLKFVEKQTGVRISLVSTGPGRDETIER